MSLCDSVNSGPSQNGWPGQKTGSVSGNDATSQLSNLQVLLRPADRFSKGLSESPVEVSGNGILPAAAEHTVMLGFLQLRS